MREVLISGIGIHAPIGSGVADFWRALVSGTSGIRPVRRFDTCWLPVHIGAEMPEAATGEGLTTEEKARLGLADRVTVSAGRMALADAGLQPGTRRFMDYYLGTTAGRTQDYMPKILASYNSPQDRLAISREAVCEHALSGWLRTTAGLLGVAGRQSLVINACAAGSYALSLAAERIRRGETELALAGGVDVLNETFFAGFCSLRSMAPEACQPFDRDRKGVVLGEAAALLVLESEASLRRRQGRAWARLAGIGWSCDGYHMSQPHPQGLGSQRAMARALADAGVPASAIGAFVAHGTGTPSNDLVEANVVAKVFGSPGPAVTAPKSMLGHSLGAASAAEAVVGILMLHHQAAPPIVRLEHQDPACRVDCVQGQARPLALAGCMTHSTGFGGNNAALVFTPAPEDLRR